MDSYTSIFFYTALVATMIFLIYSIVLVYHWFSFSLRRRGAWNTAIIYFAISAVFIAYLFISARAL